MPLEIPAPDDRWKQVALWRIKLGDRSIGTLSIRPETEAREALRAVERLKIETAKFSGFDLVPVSPRAQELDLELAVRKMALKR